MHVKPRDRERYVREVANLTRLRGALLITEGLTEEQVRKVLALIDPLIEEIRSIMNAPQVGAE